MKFNLLLIFLLMFVSGCSNIPVKNINIPLENMPNYFVSRDNVKIYYKEFNAVNKNKATICIIQGSGGGFPEDYVSLYCRIIKQMKQQEQEAV